MAPRDCQREELLRYGVAETASVGSGVEVADGTGVFVEVTVALMVGVQLGGRV